MATHTGSTQNPAPGRSLWDRQHSETSRQFACFREYRDLHPLERSLAAVGQKLGKSTSYLERLSSQLHWVQRVAVFDREQDRIGQAKRIREIQEMNERHAEIAAAIRGKVAECLDAMDPTSLRPSEVARLLEVASRVERMARGVLPDEPVVRAGFHFDAEDVRRKLKEDGFSFASPSGELA